MDLHHNLTDEIGNGRDPFDDADASPTARERLDAANAVMTAFAIDLLRRGGCFGGTRPDEYTAARRTEDA